MMVEPGGKLILSGRAARVILGAGFTSHFGWDFVALGCKGGSRLVLWFEDWRKGRTIVTVGGCSCGGELFLSEKLSNCKRNLK